MKRVTVARYAADILLLHVYGRMVTREVCCCCCCCRHGTARRYNCTCF